MTLPYWLSIKHFLLEQEEEFFYLSRIPDFENTDYPENVLIFWEREKLYFFKII